MESKKAFVFLAEGFEDMEALCTVDVLRRGGVEVMTVALGSSDMVSSSHQVTVKADTTFDRLKNDDVDALILPGGPGADAYKPHHSLSKLIKKCYSEGKLICAICAAPTFLAGIGLLEGKRAVCYPGMEEALDGAVIGTEVVEKDGNIITSKGPATALFFGLKILECLCGTAVCQEVYKQMHVELIQGETRQ